ncbi:MAG: hypothetical protein K2O34_05500 [Acetatifactor sp.]|nr:hypothetical protein [Acetatifactor sp.]
MRKADIYILIIMFAFLLAGCGKKMDQAEIEESETTIESVLLAEVVEDDVEENSIDMLQAPSRDEVLAMREKVLKGMSKEEIDRLNENIKVANLRMESAYLNENIFDKLSDKDSVYWQYFDQKGDIQLGWWYNQNICSMDMIMRAEGITEEEFHKTYDEPGMVYNRFDAENFMDLIEDMMNSVHDEKLSADLQQLIDLTDLAAATHDMQYANEIYKILHDLDYYLLRYGIEDVGKYMQDVSTVATYYGVLNVYSGKPFQPENKYYIVEYQNVDNDETEYGNIRQEHEEFRDQDGNSFFYYDVDCFYFDETFPAILNKTLQTFYDQKKETYHYDSEIYAGGPLEESNMPPSDSLIFNHVTYVGDDYVSLLFNDVSYMGGVHPYSAFEGITIDCSTGEIVTVNRFIDDSDEEIGEQIKAILGTDASELEGWDYYITDRNVVFFYYDPRFWDSVATKRLR